MTELIRVAGWSERPALNAVFIHGLGGHPYDTWQRGKNDGSYWPVWLARDIRGLSVWTLSYAAPPTNWLGSAMPLQDRAINVLERLLAEPLLEAAPLVLICHSLGGLVVKQMLREANDQKNRSTEVAALLARVRAVIFIATPHTGAAHATLLDKLRLIVWPSNSVRDLVKNDPNLRNLNVWYRNWSATENIGHMIFYETQGTAAGVIVDPGSGDAGLISVTPIPIDANHISICKPFEITALLYQRTKARIADLAKETAPKKKPKASAASTLKFFDLPAIQKTYTRPWGPILLRLAVVVFVAFIGFKGIQAVFFPGDALAEATIEEITEALQRKDPAPSLDEIDRFVGSLRALAGEPSFENAVEEAKRGNTRIAEGIWEQIYEKRKRDQEAARTEQAEAARNLGASAAITNAAKSLSWYREATLLDPANMQGWRGLGDAAMKAGTVTEAERARQRYLDLARKENSEWDVMIASNELGEVLQAKNSLSRAFTLYSEALSIARKLRTKSPEEAEWARDVSVSLNRIGDVLVARNDLTGALKNYREGLEIARALYDQDKSHAERARDVSVSLNRIGNVLVARNDLEGALKHYQEGLEIARVLYDQDKSHAERARDVSVSLERIGDVLVARNDLEGALKHYQEGLEIRRALYDQDKSHAERARDVSVSLNRIGDVLVARNDLTGALKNYREGLEIARALYDQDKSHAERARDVSVSLERIGDVLVARNDLEGALKHYQEGLEIRRALYDQDKSHAERARDVSVSLDRIGDVLRARNDLEGALKNYQEGLEIARVLYDQDKSHAERARDVSVSLDRIGDVLRARNDLEGALKNYQEGLEIARVLYDQDKSHAERARDVSVSLNRIGDVLVARNDLTGALKNYREGLEIARALYDQDKSHAGRARDVSVSLYKVASVTKLQNNLSHACASFREGLSIIKKLMTAAPDVYELASDFALFEERIKEADCPPEQ